MSDEKSGVQIGCGCLSPILGFLLIWALLFGVTVGGRHYFIDCSCAHGVSVE